MTEEIIFRMEYLSFPQQNKKNQTDFSDFSTQALSHPI